jgi:hypothetical protein
MDRSNVSLSLLTAVRLATMNTKQTGVIKALERLAFQTGTGRTVSDREDLQTCLSNLCASYSGQSVSMDRIGIREIERARGVAHGLLYGAASIVEPPRKENAERVDDDTARAAILKMAMDIMRPSPEAPARRPRAREMTRSAESLLAHGFSVKAITATGELRIIGPRDAPPWYVVAFAMWAVAREVPVSVWLRYVERRCPTCERSFYDRRWVMQGRERRYCSKKCYKRRSR